jgi:hypothetical protein
MNNRLHIVLEAFLVGMLFEYLLRVEVSFFPLLMVILLSGSIILDFILDYYTNKKNRLIKEIQHNTQQIIINENNSIKVPKGWMVYDAGQSPLHMLWHIQLVNFDDVANNVEGPRHVFVDECDSYEQALEMAINKINNIESIVAEVEKL